MCMHTHKQLIHLREGSRRIPDLSNRWLKSHNQGLAWVSPSVWVSVCWPWHLLFAVFTLVSVAVFGLWHWVLVLEIFLGDKYTTSVLVHFTPTNQESVICGKINYSICLHSVSLTWWAKQQQQVFGKTQTVHFLMHVHINKQIFIQMWVYKNAGKDIFSSVHRAFFCWEKEQSDSNEKRDRIIDHQVADYFLPLNYSSNNHCSFSLDTTASSSFSVSMLNYSFDYYYYYYLSTLRFHFLLLLWLQVSFLVINTISVTISISYCFYWSASVNPSWL